MSRLARRIAGAGRAARRPPRPDVAVGRGERVLAWAAATDGGVVAGTRDAAYLPGGLRLPWEQVEAAEWDVEAGRLVVTEVGSWGTVRAVHSVALAVPEDEAGAGAQAEPTGAGSTGAGDPRSLLQLVRERVTASVVSQRHVAVRGRAGVRVVGRRATSGDRSISWLLEYDEGVDPDDPRVARLADEALAAARAEVGDTAG